MTSTISTFSNRPVPTPGIPTLHLSVRYDVANRRTPLSRNTTIVVSVAIILLVFGNGWQAWIIQDLRADLEIAEDQITTVKMRAAAAMGPAAMEQGQRKRKAKTQTAGNGLPQPADRRARRGQTAKVSEIPGPGGAALSPEAQVERRDELRGHLRDAVLNKMLDRVAEVAHDRGWEEGATANAMIILEDSVAATAEVRLAKDAGDYTADEAKDEVLRIKDDAAFALEDALGTDEHQYLQERLWAKGGR